MKHGHALLAAPMLLLLSACNSHDGNHLNLLQLPGAMISTGIENAVYSHTRQNIASYAKLHYRALRAEIRRGSGKHLDTLLYLAKIQKARYTKVKHQLHKDYAVIFHNTESIAERIMHSLEQPHAPKEGTKRMHRVNHTQTYSIVRKYIQDHFEALRLDIKEGKTHRLATLAEKLSLNDTQKRQRFIHALDGQHDQLYVDTLVASVMVHQ